MDEQEWSRAAEVAAELNGWGRWGGPWISPAPWAGPLGGEGDRRAMALLDEVRHGTPVFREAVARLIDDRGADALAGVSRRLAVLGVRERSRAVLERGILALALAAHGAGDLRDVLMVADLPGHSARLIGEDPARLYREVAGWSPALGATFLHRHAPRDTAPLSPEEGRSVGTGGQIEGVGKDGAFDYLPPPPRPRDSTSLARNLNATAFGSLLDAAEAAAAIPGPFDRTVSTFWDFTRGMHDVEKE